MMAGEEQIRESMNGAQPFDAPGAVLVKLSEIKAEAVRWLWPARIALGKLALIAGDPGLGKSFVSLDVAARVTCGRAWPDGAPGCTLGDVILLSAEDGAADTIRPRADAAGADPDRIEILRAVRESNNGNLTERHFSLDGDVARLDEALARRPGVKLVVVDPVTAYLGSLDSHKNAELRGALMPLAALAEKRGIAILLVSHLNKGQAEALYRVSGSNAFVAAPRTAWLVTQDPANEGPRRLMLQLKNNLSPNPGGLAFKIESDEQGRAAVAWEQGRVDLSAREALAPERRERGPKPAKSEAAAVLLRNALSDGAEHPSEYLIKQAGEDGISYDTLSNAAKSLGVRRQKGAFKGGWVWWLPQSSNGVSHDGAHVNINGAIWEEVEL
jgi:putative DNA primase/helicase